MLSQRLSPAFLRADHASCSQSSYALWGNEALYSSESKHYQELWMVEDSTAMFWGFVLNRVELDLAVMAGIAIVYRVIAFILMICTNRRKQL